MFVLICRWHENIRHALKAFNVGSRTIHDLQKDNPCPAGSPCNLRGNLPTSPFCFLERALCDKGPLTFFDLECVKGTCIICAAGVTAVTLCEKENHYTTGRIVRTPPDFLFVVFAALQHVSVSFTSYMFKVFSHQKGAHGNQTCA